MSGKDNDEYNDDVASSPCFMHEADPAYMWASDATTPETAPIQPADLKLWRNTERARLIKDRLSIPTKSRRLHDARITESLETALGTVEGLTVSAYWPFRGEPNLLPFLEGVEARGGHCALPVAIALGQPLIFRAWATGEPLERGVWNIPIPGEQAPVVIPDVVIAPVIGFDPAGYRLGYGGGFFDRTLAALAEKPRVFGVGYGQAALPTIHPQWHDIPMDIVITENGPVSSTLKAKSAPT